MNLYYEVAAQRSEGTRSQPQGVYHTAYLDDHSANAKAELLVVMADGVEGHAGGPIATNLTVSTFNRYFLRRFSSVPLPDLLRASVEDANLVLGRAVQETPKLEGMACTLVSAVLAGGHLYWASVGDAHLYLLRGGALRKLNVDHSYGGYLARVRAQGVEVEPEPGLTPDMLMSAVTGAAIDEIDCPSDGLPLRPGDRVVVASRDLARVGEAGIVNASRAAAETARGVAVLLAAGAGPDADRRKEMTVIVVDVMARAPVPASPSRAVVARTASGAVSQDAVGRPSPLLDAISGLLSVVVFVAVAAGTWYGMERLDAFREGSAPASGVPAVVSVPPSAPAPVTGPGSQPGLSFGAPPPPSPPPPGGLGGTADGGALSFGAPAPVPGTGAVPETAPTPRSEAGGFRDVLKAGGEGPLMARIPAGRFEMGGSGQSLRAEERPRHTVAVPAFALGRYEVTVAEYRQFAQATGRKMPDIDVSAPETTPVSGVTWDDAYAYSRWLSQQTGARYRLPSEAEWEYAARGGAASAYWWGQEMGRDLAHCFDCDTGLDPRRPTQVGRFSANAFGLHDTAGNVAEWVHDCWHANYRGAPDDGTVWEGGDCSLRVVRGGSFSSPAASLRVHARAALPANQGVDAVGFRVARDVQP